jgi:hypothetical protein
MLSSPKSVVFSGLQNHASATVVACWEALLRFLRSELNKRLTDDHVFLPAA